jgi:hypothetical protein
MSKVADVSEPASELERLIADLSESGQLVSRNGSRRDPHGRG